ncbi:MAG: hypothetical protein ACXVKJ_19290 [Ilumatobacteraceae bacterium]
MTQILQHDPTLGVDFVEVDNEPRHVEQLRNELVRVYVAAIEPGSCTLYHRHRANTLYIVLSGGSTRSAEPGHQKQRTGVGRSIATNTKIEWLLRRKLARAMTLPTGTVMMQYHEQLPLTHRVCAASANGEPLRMLGIELLAAGHLPSAQPPTLGALPVEYHDPQSTTYRLDLAPRQTTGRLTPGQPALLVTISDGTQLQLPRRATSRTLASGAVQWLDPDDDLELTNPTSDPALAYLITLSSPAHST